MKKVHTQKAIVRMPCGDVLDLKRPRSAGVLSDAELAVCRAENIALAYDPVQVGWIPATCEDDIDSIGMANRAGWPDVARSAVARRPQINAMRPQYRLRAWEQSDLETYVALLDDGAVWAHLPEAYPDPLGEDMAAALIELSNASNHHQVFAVLRNTDIVGQVRLLYDVDDADPGAAEISYWLGRAHWGKGIGSDVVAMFTTRCFDDNSGLSSIIARVKRGNAASERVLRKAGYQLEGVDPKDNGWQIFRITRDAV